MKSTVNTPMKVFLALGLLLSFTLQGTLAHTYLSSVVLGGTALSEGDCVRPHPSTAYDSPIPLITAPDMTCGFLPYSSEPANRRCPIAAGSTIGVQWHHQSTAATDDIIDPSHKGPLIFYLAKSDTGAGNVWFKIYEDGYTASTGLWAVDKLIANHGLVQVTIPADIAPGNYLLRGEVLALHNAYALNGVQPYVGCIELSITGSGTANPSGVAFPGAYSDNDPGILFNLYTAFSSYVIPGPPLHVSGSGSSASASASSSGASSGSAATTGIHASTSSASTSSASASSTSAKSSTSGSAASTTGQPATGPVSVTVYSSASIWWFALTVSGVSSSSIESIQVKDSGSYSTYSLMTYASWGYYKATTGLPFTAPLTVLITSTSGKTATATVSTITPNLEITATGEL